MPAKFTRWPDQHEPIHKPSDIEEAYKRGWQGCIPNEPAKEELRELFTKTSGYADIEAAAHDRGWADSAAGKLVVPFRCVQARWPHAYPGEAQKTGCCVSMGTRNAILITLACELASHQVDPDSGEMEGAPEVPAAGEKTGVLSNAPIYWRRNYNGDGWDCPSAAKVVVEEIGCVVAQSYPDLGVDLTHCNAQNDHRYGSQRPPDAIMKAFGEHRLKSAAEVTSFEQLRDLLANGYGVNSCGGEGFSGTRDANGVMPRQGSWSHSMGYGAVDDRSKVKKIYGCGLVGIQQSWGQWGSGPRKILGTDLELPEGWFWAKWTDVSRRYMVAFSNVHGWPAQKLPDYGSAAGFN